MVGAEYQPVGNLRMVVGGTPAIGGTPTIGKKIMNYPCSYTNMVSAIVQWIQLSQTLSYVDANINGI